MTDTAVLARVERVRPNADGSGKLTYRGPVHLFNGRTLRNETGTVKAWCGAQVASVDLRVVEDRSGSGAALYADICRRCFIEPRGKVEVGK